MKIKVVHIITKLELGGAQQNTLYTVENLNREKFQVYLLSGADGYLVEKAKSIKHVEFIPVHTMDRPLSPVKDIKAILEIKKILQRIKPDIVHTHSSKAGVLGRWAARLAGVPVIIHSVHGFAFHPFMNKLRRRLYIWAERITAKITTAFIAVAMSNINKGVHSGIFTENKCQVIRSGIDIDLFRNAKVDRAKKLLELGIEDTGKIICMVACLKPQKAPLDFAKVAWFVLNDHKDARFLLIGDGELRGEMENAVSSYGLEGKFFMPGWREDIPEILKAVDIFVLTSLWEGLPRVFAEAMSAGLPIVGSEVDGAHEIVHDTVDGFLLPPHDIRGFADAIIQLLDNPVLRKQMGSAGTDYIQEFDIKLMIRQQEQLYEKLTRAIK